MHQADEGIARLREVVDTLIVIPNERLLGDGRAAHLDHRRIPRGGQRPAPGRPGHHRPHHDPGPDQPRLRRRPHDHAGRRLGPDGHRHVQRREPRRRGRAQRDLQPAARAVRGRRHGIIFNITGGKDLGLFEVNEAAEVIHDAADPNANIIFGAVIDEHGSNDDVRVTVIATGFDHGRARPRTRARTRGPARPTAIGPRASAIASARRSRSPTTIWTSRPSSAERPKALDVRMVDPTTARPS